MRFFVVSDDDVASSMVRGILLDRGFECPVSQQVSLLGTSSVIQQLKLAQSKEEAKPAPSAHAEIERFDSTIVVVLSPDIDRALESVRQIRANSNQKILALGPLNDPKLVVRAIRDGANEYLDMSETEGELTQALDRIEEQTGRGKLVGVLSAIGGAGVSSLAVNLACLLAQKPKTCALVDLKVEGGDLASLLDLKPNHTLADVSRGADSLDYTLLKGCLTPHDTGIQLLASPTRLPSFGEVQAQGVMRSMALMRHHFDYLVADLDRCLGQESVSAAQSADMLLVVLRLDFLSVRRTKLMLEFLKNQVGIKEDKIQLVANRTGLPGEISVSQAETAVSSKIPWQLMDDVRTMIRGTNNGEPIVIHAASTKIAKKMGELATRIKAMG